jgi:hypothetical protein
VEKARSLLEAEANLDEVDEHTDESNRRDESSRDPSRAESGLHSSSAGGQRALAHPSPSGFVPASATQSGLAPRFTPERASSSSPGETTVMSSRQGQLPGDRLLDTVQSALGAASRNESGLGSLQRAIRDASRAFTASRQAHEALTEELRVMHRGLNELMSEKAAIERYAALLTQERDAALDAAEEARREAKRDREFLLREQDRFIQLLLEEHEAELQQLRRSLGQRSSGSGETSSGASAAGSSAAAQTGASDVAPKTIPGVAPAIGEEVAEDRKSAPPGEFLSGAALARQALASSAGGQTSGSGVDQTTRTVPMPEERSSEGTEARRPDGEVGDERHPTYPPAPAVLDLDSLAAEVDGNSERPPPIRRIGIADPPKIHLKPARIPTQLYDTLVSPSGEGDPNRKG